MSHMIGRADIEKLAELSRIEIPPEEMDTFVKEIDSILAYVEQVKEVSTIVPSQTTGLLNVMRGDDNPHESGVYTEDIIKAAPDKEANYIKVKKILTN